MSSETKKPMKVIGGRNLPPQWERFDRLQRTAHVLLGRAICPKGVFRFKSYEEFNEWKAKVKANHKL